MTCFGNMYCEYSQYLEVPDCGYFLYYKYFVLRYCGYIFACALGVLYAHTLSTLSLWAFSVPATFWPLLIVLQYSQYSEYELFSSIHL